MEKTNTSHEKKKKNLPLGKAGGKTCPLSPSIQPSEFWERPDTPGGQQPG